jgi:hypothetical protein
MILYSQRLEFTAIRTICNRKLPPVIRAQFLSQLDETYFHYPPCHQAFQRIKRLLKLGKRVPLFSHLIEDPVIDEDERNMLRHSPPRIVNSKETAQELIDLLDQYRQIRLHYQHAKATYEALKKEKVDADHLNNQAADTLNRARSLLRPEQQLWVFGRGGNALKLAKEVLHHPTDQVLKTGFRDFDSKNGGLVLPGVLVLGSTTGGGKSTLLNQLLFNLHTLNYSDTCKISLEMSQEREMRRILANLSKTSLATLTQGTYSKKDAKTILKAAKRFDQFGQQNKCRWAYLSPTKGMTIDQLLAFAQPYQFQVLGIDYISLLEGTSNDRQWQTLSEITRQCKIFSTDQNCLVILLVQLDEVTDKIRYSRAIKEHCDNFWYWNYSDETERLQHVLHIHQGKARDQEPFPFNLREDFEYMTVNDLPPDTESPTLPKKSKHHANGKNTDDLDLPVEEDSSSYIVC